MTVSAKHTPGPWSLDSDAGQVHIVAAGAAIARVMAMRSDGCGEANARLIAAAPDLLAELQNIANANPSSWDEETRDQFQQWAQNRARAAIAKATGAQS
jgi:hypothetical protein